MSVRPRDSGPTTVSVKLAQNFRRFIKSKSKVKVKHCQNGGKVILFGEEFLRYFVLFLAVMVLEAE